ncbi:MAG: hypothetical protein ACRDCF_01410, partial [Mycoplasmoidaceae bacterium]
MKKNIKILIASLSVLTVAATVTAITVPLVMNAKQIDDSNFIKDNTVKTATIKENSLMKEILEANTEKAMRDKVKEFNKQVDIWDKVFTFTNDNNKNVTNVVNEVMFSLDNDSTTKQAIFSIKYKDGIQAASGANIVKVNVNSIKDLSVTRVDDFDIKVQEISDKLNDLLKKEPTQLDQKKLYDSWGTNIPTEISSGVRNLFNFKEGGEKTWTMFVKDISVTPGQYQVGEEMPPIGVKVNLKSGYLISSNNEKELKFDIVVKNPTIDLDIAESTDYNDKLINATKVLNGLLTGDFNEQKEIYEGWNNKSAPNTFKESIKGILSFNNGSVSWDLAVKDVVLTTGTFPSQPGEQIPSVGISIKLNDIYSISSGEQLLSFNSNDLGNSNLINIKVTGEIEAAAAATTYLETIVTGSYDEQETAYTNLNGNATEEFINSIKNEIIFNGGNVSWDDAVA